mgnify:CR=1 FL=1
MGTGLGYADMFGDEANIFGYEVDGLDYTFVPAMNAMCARQPSGELVAGYGRAFGMRVIVWGSETSRARALSDGYDVATSKEGFFETATGFAVNLAARFFQGFQRLGHQLRNGTRRGAQPNPPRQALHLTLHVFQCLLRIGQQAAGTLDQGFANRRRLHTPAGARQQRAAHTGFKLGDMQADRGRRQVEHPRRFGKRAQVGNGHQRTQAVEADFTHENAPYSEKLNLIFAKFNFYYLNPEPKMSTADF